MYYFNSLLEKMYSQLDMYGEVQRGRADSSRQYLDSSHINPFEEQCSPSDSLAHIINELDIACTNDSNSTEEMTKKNRFILKASDGSNISSTNMQFNEAIFPISSNSRGIKIYVLFMFKGKYCS